MADLIFVEKSSLCLLWYGKQKDNDATIWTFYTFPATSATIPLTYEWICNLTNMWKK